MGIFIIITIILIIILVVKKSKEKTINPQNMNTVDNPLAEMYSDLTREQKVFYLKFTIFFSGIVSWK